MMRNGCFWLFAVLVAPALQVCLPGCSPINPVTSPPSGWPISKDAFTTAQQQILPVALPSDTPPINPADVPLYETFGYSAWHVGPGLPYEKRADLAPAYTSAPNAARLLTFFTMSDVHIIDKESPAQALYMGWAAAFGPSSAGMSSAYSPILLSTTQVLDAAVQTVNALHAKSPLDFGIFLGDATNNTQYNELRWYIDVLDGQVITPSSGAHAGDDTIDYQFSYQAAGLNSDIPWYQVIGNHDQFWSGSAFEDAKTRAAHVGSTILNMDPVPNPASGGVDRTGAYMGVVDGTTPFGDVVGCGLEALYPTPPTVVPDPDRRSLATEASTTLNWMSEFFRTTSSPVGHGFTRANLDNDFACYSFIPKADVPIKVIALDDTVKGPGQPNYAAGALDPVRLEWLKAELQAGQDAGQLMIIAAHVPIYPQQTLDPTSGNYPLLSSTSSIDDQSLLAVLHTYPNLILWIAGHRHVNVVTPQPSPDATQPELGFWEVETASLRDFPQQFRTFDILRNSDNTISIIVTDVDPAVVDDTPAWKSRGYAIGAARIFGATPAVLADTTSHAYNAELVKQLTPAMQATIAAYGTALDAAGE